MKYQKIYYTIGRIPKSKGKIVERAKSTTLTHVYMTTQFPSLVQVLQQNRAGLNKFCWQNPSLLVK